MPCSSDNMDKAPENLDPAAAGHDRISTAKPVTPGRGKISELQFMGGKIDPKTNRRALVRAKVSIEQRVKDSIHEDADFYVTTQGVLGEQFLAIDPGSPQ